MASTYTGTHAAAGVQPVFLPTGDITVFSSYALTGALVINDIINMMVLPPGVTVRSVLLSSDTALDTNGTAQLAYDVGDGASATRYIANKVQGNNTALAPYSMDQPSGHQYVIGTNAGDTVIKVKVRAAPATAATTGTIRLSVTYRMQSELATS
jgi:hypothetical protein